MTELKELFHYNNQIILAAILAILIALIIEHISLKYLREKKRAVKRESLPGERIQQSISKLTNASQEVDIIIQDVIKDIKNRHAILEELKTTHQSLVQEEKELSKRVEALKGIPIEVAKYFQQINEEALQQMENKRAKRDILMFIFGIIVTTVIAMILRSFGLA